MISPNEDAAWDDAAEVVGSTARIALEMEALKRTGRPINPDESFARHFIADAPQHPDDPQHDLLMVLGPRWVVDSLLARLFELADELVPVVASDAN